MSDLHKSLDETIAAIREQHESEMQQCKDKTLAAEVRAELLQDQLNRAIEARTFAERVTTRLLTQFAVVEKVFAEAKAMAVAHESHDQQEHSDQQDDPKLPIEPPSEG